MRPELDTGVPGGELLMAFSDAVIGPDSNALDSARASLADGLGAAAVTAASSIAGNFSKNDRIANALGIPVDAVVLKGTADIRKQLGLDDFGSAINTFRHPEFN